MTVRIYHNHDTDAPVLEATPGSMINVLEAVLVDGYGDKAPLGWTKEFHTGNIAVFRNDPSVPGSTGCYLRIDDTASDHSQLRIYKSMSDIDTGTDPAPRVSDNSNSITWRRHYSGSGGPKWWTLIGDERTFYLSVATSGAWPDPGALTSNYSSQIFIAGDYESEIPGNEWNYILAGDAYWNSFTSNYHFPYHSGNTSRGTAYIGRTQGLLEDTSDSVSTLCLWGRPGSNSEQPPFSVYTGKRYFMPAFLAETRDGRAVSGKLRGAHWFLGGTQDNWWFENLGKLPEEPTGPNLRVLKLHPQAQNCSIVIKEDNWDD